MDTRRDVVKFLAGAVLGASLAAPAFAAGDTLPETMDKPGGFPERPLAMIVPYGPAGGSGQVAQAMIQGVKDATGLDITPDYKPGGSGMVGLKTYMAAPADGYTVLEHIDDATSAFAIGKSDIHPANDLIPLVISQITFSQIYIRVNEDRFTDWDSYVAYVKSQGGKSTIANVSGEGSMERINMNRIADHFGMELQQISFDKGAPRYGALKGGQVDALFEQPGDVRNFLESGDFKPILTLLKERPGAFPDTPSMTDVGLDFTPLMRFRGFYVHKDVPADRVAYLQWAFQKGFYSDSYQAFNKKKFMDLIPSFRDTEGAKVLINDTMEIYKATYKEMGLIE
ncbi:MAG: tripartite tricarboxylate transporter substrate binding protein [Rhodospirillales bacterium]|nr:tripartite tricarboxylate transporter substrate binding protein [Rhodospirillales bacterium]